MSRRRVPFVLVRPDRRFQALQLAWLQGALISKVEVEQLPPHSPQRFALGPGVLLLSAAHGGVPWPWRCPAWHLARPVRVSQTL